MSELNVFTFDGYVLRPAGVDDLEMAEAWTAADPAHHGTRADFWISNRIDVKSYLLVDRHGPVFFFRMQARFGAPPEAGSPGRIRSRCPTRSRSATGTPM